VRGWSPEGGAAHHPALRAGAEAWAGGAAGHAAGAAAAARRPTPLPPRPGPAHAGRVQHVALEQRVRAAQLCAHERRRFGAQADAAAGPAAAARGGELVGPVRGPDAVVVGAAPRARRGELRRGLRRGRVTDISNPRRPLGRRPPGGVARDAQPARAALSVQQAHRHHEHDKRRRNGPQAVHECREKLRAKGGPGCGRARGQTRICKNTDPWGAGTEALR
jgi:hypothetical protein